MIKIAIIEDDQIISQMYRMKFEAAGYEVQIADNGGTGIDLVKSFAPDIILLDLQMPKMNGVEALKTIRQNDWGRTVPVIVLTNTSEAESPNELKNLGVHSYIVKANLTPSQVLEQVKLALK